MQLGLIYPAKKPDIDNVVKSVTDALNGLAYGDDSQIVSLYVHKRYGLVPMVEVEISRQE
jgi:Holliday junction resolvase RusA-like endonuclease